MHLAHGSAAYSSDAIYLYSTRDDPEPTSMASRESSLLPPNKKRQRLNEDSDGCDTLESDSEEAQERAERDAMMDEDIERILAEDTPSPRRRRELRPLLSDNMDEDDPDVRHADEDDEDDEEDWIVNDDVFGIVEWEKIGDSLMFRDIHCGKHCDICNFE